MRPGFLWLAGFRDLQWRRRRFVIAVLGSSLVFALTLMLTGFLSTFDVEIQRATSVVGADGYIVPAGRPGPFTGSAPLATSTLDAVRALPGVKQADPIVTALLVTDRKAKPDVFVFGANPGGFGSPHVDEGRVPTKPGEAVIDKSAKLAIGDTFSIGVIKFEVVGSTSKVTVLGYHPAAFVILGDAQQLLFGAPSAVTAIAVHGAPKVVPPGLVYVNEKVAQADLRRPQLETMDSVRTFRLMLWVVAGAVIGSVVYLSALERLGDFAVFKAIGTRTVDLLGALVFQAVLLSLSASILAILVGRLLAPLYPVPISFPGWAIVEMPVVGLVVGVLASVVALRRAVTVDPALAFGGH